MANLVKRKPIHDALPVDQKSFDWQWFGNVGHFMFQKLFVPCDPDYTITSCWLEQGHKGPCKTKEELYGGMKMAKSEEVRRTAAAEAKEGCLKRARERGDECFTLVGQDMTAPTVICEWIKQNIE